MKKLFLSSAASNTLDKILPLLPKSPNQLKLAFIPTAANLDVDKPWLYKDRDKLIALGFKVVDVDIEGKSEKELEKELHDIDVLFVSGGNTFYLLEKARQSGFDQLAKKLIDKGVIYIGSSAGSVFACPTVEYVNKFDDPSVAPSLISYTGLGIVNYLIIPHYGTEEHKKDIEDILNVWESRGYEIKLLTNNQAIIVDGDEFTTVEV